ncbi:MAG: hypothetical protein PHD02_00070 [Bacilli bacterium]|nr:hypothetical protein [Bacilli bacterium]
METIFSVIGIKYTLGYEVERRVPKKYLEGFVSLYMIPIHGFGILLAYEPILKIVEYYPLVARFLIWGILFCIAEFIVGFLFEKFFGFFHGIGTKNQNIRFLANRIAYGHIYQYGGYMEYYWSLL